MSQPAQPAQSTNSPTATATPTATPPPPPSTVDVDKAKKTVTQRFYFVIHIFLRPVIFPFSVIHSTFRESKNITIVIIQELKKVGKLGLNFAELSFLLVRAVNIIIFKDGNTKPLMPRMMDVYNKMVSTLTHFHVLPCTKESGALGHLMLSRLPKIIWENLLPYPHPFFRGSITQAMKTDTNVLITSTEAVPDGQYKPFTIGKKSK